MDKLDRAILDLLQQEFPLSWQPWQELSQRLAISPAELLARIGALKTAGVIRRIGGVMDARRIGYHSCLCALKIGEEQMDTAVAVINAHPGVTHNYERDHEYRLWFTLTMRTAVSLERQLTEWEDLLHCHILRLPALRTYKIRVYFPMLSDTDSTPGPGWNGASASTTFGIEPPTPSVVEGVESGSDAVLPAPTIDPAFDQDIFIFLQDDLPLQSEPYQPLADRLQVSPTRILARIAELQREGKIRRLTAILRHHQAGYRANAMVVWKVAEDQIDYYGELLAGHSAVSHCYRRAIYEQFPWPLYTMVHAHNREQLAAIVEELAATSGLSEYQVIYSVSELKKSSLRFDI